MRAVLLDLLDFLKVFLKGFRSMWRVVPFRRFFNNCSDRSIFNDNSDVDGIVHAAENPALIRIRHIHVLEKLKPEGLKFVSIVLEEIKVVSNGGEYFVEVFLEVAAILFRFHLPLHLNFTHWSRAASFRSCCTTRRRRGYFTTGCSILRCSGSVF